MRLNQLPPAERPRERLLRCGAQALTEIELLALFLRTGVAGQDALELAQSLLINHGGLPGLLRAGAGQLLAARGLGPAKATQLLAALELSRRFLEAGLRQGEMLTDPARAGEYLSMQLRPHLNEVFAVIFLDNQHRMLAFEELFTGTINSTEVHPREIVRRALAHNAAAVILAHNHPSGVAEPSVADQSLTRRIVEAMALIGVRVLDHFIVGAGPPTSLAERGML
ncbi:MAG: hypothetical protein COS34_07130 [Lysobacterales bacterium CG02_land_8_20_14_3_00_62_12]|nr:MAG: hypothetical protein COS34_07130 [Xanthomonadales bacterium CG02_land_8_20_14_3_00_62_12]PJA42356.1 MAG: hypothetical protein CO182_02930 [Xanthomonadales bacterium CG_4_9_14_3_um_filter_62_6]